MKIAFIRPNLAPGMRSADAMHPLVFAILAGLTPDHHDWRLFDERLEDIPFDMDVDLVAMTVETYTARRAYQISAEFRRRGIPVVMGGYHATLATEELSLHADSVAVGDAESIWPHILEDAETGRLQPLYRDPGTHDLRNVVYDRSVFAGKKYMPLQLVSFHRGCRYACDFCSIRAFYGDNQRHRPVDEVLAEVEGLGARAIFFADDNLFSDPPAARELLRGMRNSGVRWAAQLSIDATESEEDLDLMRDSGCAAVLIGFESLERDSLREMKKGWNTRHGSYAECVRRLRERSIMVYGTFVFGYEHDTIASFDAALDFCLGSNLYLANFNPLTPTPGTPLYARLKEEGRLLFDPWWLNPDFRYGSANFIPSNMSAAELTAGCFRTRKRFYSYRSIARRALDWRANARNPINLWLYLSSNLVSRREIFNKQGRVLGGERLEAHAH